MPLNYQEVIIIKQQLATATKSQLVYCRQVCSLYENAYKASGVTDAFMIFASLPPVNGTGLENYDLDQRLKIQAEDLVHFLVLDMCYVLYD